MVDSRRLACWPPRPDQKSLSVQQEVKGGDMVICHQEMKGKYTSSLPDQGASGFGQAGLWAGFSLRDKAQG